MNVKVDNVFLEPDCVVTDIYQQGNWAMLNSWSVIP